MTFLRTVQDDEATGAIAEAYTKDRANLGYVMNASRSWTTKPEMQAAWGAFWGTFLNQCSLTARDRGLIILIAAKHIRSTYCSLMYGKGLMGELDSVEQVIAVERDFRNAGLSPREVAMLEYVEQISIDASHIQPAEIERLREHGFSDENIYDIAMCAAPRHFNSRFFDAVGALPDPQLAALPADFIAAMEVGRRLEAAGD